MVEKSLDIVAGDKEGVAATEKIQAMKDQMDSAHTFISQAA